MASKRIIKYKCMFCDERHTKESLVNHVAEVHDDMIPKDFTPFRLVFNYVNKKPLTYHGKCTECGGPTPWDEKAGRYKRQCGKKACHDSYIKKFEENMIKKTGNKRISETEEGQKKMLANRKISGTYTMRDGTKKTYTGSYELKALEFMDKVMELNSDDIFCPGPILEYEFEGKKHFYITDFYYQPYNLVIEVKDGGENPNKRSMPEYRAKQIKKEEFLIKHTDYNYLRLTDNNLAQLLAVFCDLKLQMQENKERVIHVNENMTQIGINPVIGLDHSDAYITNYMMHNSFTDTWEDAYGVTDSIRLDHIIGRDDKNRLAFIDKKSIKDIKKLKKLPLTLKEVSDKLSPYMNTEVSEEFLYETLLNKKMHTIDQVSNDTDLVESYDNLNLKIMKECKNLLSYIYEGNVPRDVMVSSLKNTFYHNIKEGF